MQACERAIADAGLEMDDIDGLSTYPGAGLTGPFGEGGVTALEAALGIRPTWYNGGGETFGPGGSVIAAMLAVAGGLARHVLCFRTQLSHGRTHGMGLLAEAIVQLRGEGGPRQVPGARVAVVSSGGLTPSGAILLRTDA